MSLQGNAAADGVLRGKIHSVDVLTIDAYGVAVRNGFEGTVEEWLKSLKGETGDPGHTPVKGVDYWTGEDKAEVKEYVDSAFVKSLGTISSVTLLADGWEGEVSPYSQVVNISGTTEHSKVDLNPTVEQLSVFHTKDLTFVTENEDGVVTVYCIGQKPTNDYTMQVTITEVIENG